MHYFKLVFALILSTTLFSTSLSARQDDQRLLPLFAELSKDGSSSDAKVLEQAIWEIWLSSGSETVDMLMFQGVEQMRRGGFKQALFLFTAIIEMDPHFAEAWNKRATVRFLVGDLNGSIDDVGKTLELEPRHFGALAGLGQIYERQKEASQAILAFEKAINLNPHMPFVQEKIRQLRIKLEGNRI